MQHRMVPGSPDLATWLAKELSLSLVEDSAEGGVVRLTGATVPEGSLAFVVSRLAGLSVENADVGALIERARAGAPGSMVIPGEDSSGRILTWAIEPGRARVLIAPTATTLAKRAAAADLAAGVTHEVANALTAIAGWTRMASASGPLPKRTREALEVVQRSTRDALGSARGLLSTMRDSARPSVRPSHEPTDVSSVVREVVETLRPELVEAQIEISLDLEEDVLGMTPPAALRLIVSNLVRNAFEALTSGGTISVQVRNRGDRMCLTVRDDGPGMDHDTLQVAFERYFTTKREGTGLGLALIRDTVHEAGGRVEVRTQRDRGTRFEIFLPVAGAARLSLRPPSVKASSSGIHPRPFLHGLRALVVDDDAATRSMVRTALELQGTVIVTASTCAEARAVETNVDLALVDLGLPDGRGDHLLRELLASGRARYGVLLTGSIEALQDEVGEDAFLRKPFELEDLLRVLQSVLSQEDLEAEDG